MKKIYFTLIFLAIIQCINAQVWKENDLLMAPDGSDGDRFGEIRYHGANYMVVASQKANIQLGENLITSPGVVYIWERGDNGKWMFLQKLTAPVGYIQTNSLFGYEVALSGEHLVISDYGSNFSQTLSQGIVFYYKQGADGLFHYETRITSNNPHENKYFGSALALTDDFLAVGAGGDNFDENGLNPMSQAGSVEMFRLSGDGDWIFHKKFVSPQRGAGHQFGREIVLSGDQLFISDPSLPFNAENTITQKTGKVHYYGYSNLTAIKGWNYITSIENPWYGKDTFFGRDLALSGNTLVVSEPSFNEYISGEEENTYTGKVHVFEKQLLTNTWTRVTSLQPEQINVKMGFGSKIAIDGDFIAVSCPGDLKDENGENELSSAGSAFIYSKKSGEWKLLQKITSSDRKELSFFCSGVGIHDGLMVLGDYRSDGQGANQGTVLSYEYSYDTGYSSLKHDLKVNLYPNPTTDVLNINLTEAEAKSTITIYSVWGTEVLHKELHNTHSQIAIGHLDKGIYFVTISTQAGEFKQRVLVQ